VKRQYVDFMVVLKGAELDSSDYANSQTRTSFARGNDTSYRVMVGERQRLEAAARGSLDYLAWWKGAVRGGGVGMKVDERRPARLSAHRV
jgi:hypothetical protein